ncbi:MAG: YcjF family protein [Planctomycetota bacterium]
MQKPLTDFARLIGRAAKLFRYAGIAVLALVVWFIGREVTALAQLAGTVHPALSWIVVAIALLLAWRLIGVPVWRYFRMPVAISPPDLPDADAAHLERRLDYLGRYLGALRRNPLLADSRGDIEAVRRDAAALRGGIRAKDEPAAALREFEKSRVEPLLEPLDREADRVIRAEALAVGVATALSPNGTLDAAIVLWRNANLVSRIGNIYYGRPGVRGSFRILRDVSSAALLATYLEGLSEVAGGVLRGMLGSVAGVVAGPLVDGSVNAIATLRVGYLAKGRCRSFRAWNDATRTQALADALAAARDRSGEVLAEIASKAGKGFGSVGDAVKGGLASLLSKLKGEETGPATA